MIQVNFMVIKIQSYWFESERVRLKSRFNKSKSRVFTIDFLES